MTYSDFLGGVSDTGSVIVAGIEHAYGAVKTVITDSYGGVKTAVTDVGGGTLSYATGLEGLAAKTSGDVMSPISGVISSFSYPIILVGGALGLMFLYQMGNTSRAAMPYMPAMIESGGKFAPLIGAI